MSTLLAVLAVWSLLAVPAALLLARMFRRPPPVSVPKDDVLESRVPDLNPWAGVAVMALHSHTAAEPCDDRCTEYADPKSSSAPVKRPGVEAVGPGLEPGPTSQASP